MWRGRVYDLYWSQPPERPSRSVGLIFCTLNLSLFTSRAVFVVSEHALSSWGTQCHQVAGAMGVFLVFKGVWGRCFVSSGLHMNVGIEGFFHCGDQYHALKLSVAVMSNLKHCCSVRFVHKTMVSCHLPNLCGVICQNLF